MKKKYENVWNMYSNSCNHFKAFAQKKNSNSPSKLFFTYVKILNFTLYYILYTITIYYCTKTKSYILLTLQFYNCSTLKVKPVPVHKKHAQYGKKEAKDI